MAISRPTPQLSLFYSAMTNILQYPLRHWELDRWVVVTPSLTQMQREGALVGDTGCWSFQSVRLFKGLAPPSNRPSPKSIKHAIKDAWLTTHDKAQGEH